MCTTIGSYYWDETVYPGMSCTEYTNLTLISCESPWVPWSTSLFSLVVPMWHHRHTQTVPWDATERQRRSTCGLHLPQWLCRGQTICVLQWLWSSPVNRRGLRIIHADGLHKGIKFPPLTGKIKRDQKLSLSWHCYIYNRVREFYKKSYSILSSGMVGVTSSAESSQPLSHLLWPSPSTLPRVTLSY